MQNLLPQLRRRVLTYGLEPGADVRGEGVELTPRGSSFQASMMGKDLGEFTVQVPGRHNVQNALAAIAVGLELEVGVSHLRAGLAHYHGADRRFQIKVEIGGVTVVDDYGHHPAEIRATVEAARLRGPRRILAVFQPHRYTRTQFLMDDFAACFNGCERVYVLDIYPASEPPIPGITSERLVARMHELGFDRAVYAPYAAEVIQEVLAEAQPGDLILTIGAGTVWKVGEALAEGVRTRSVAASIKSGSEQRSS